MIDDDELLRIVGDERRRSVGFDFTSEGQELSSARIQSLEYAKGEMIDTPSLQNRSKAISTDVSDTIETILPDLIEIFTGGEDVASFRPTGQEDEQAAEQETDYIKHVVFNENEGFMLLYSMFKDALTVKTGVAKWWAEETESEPVEYTGQTEVGLQMAAETGEIINLEASDEVGIDGQPLVNFKIKTPPTKRLRIMAVPPEDFTVAFDTVNLADTTYCAMRARPRVQDLIARGVDREVAENLPVYGTRDDQMDQARDTAGEHDLQSGDGATLDLKIVETVEHFVRVLDGDKLCIYKVLTGGNETVLIDKEVVEQIQFAAITPFVVTHRFYGESIADRVMEIQRIKTALTRIALDNFYFALNQRYEIDESQMSGLTMSDLLNNAPGMPVRSKNGRAVRALSAGGINGDPFRALEYMSTVSEQRTGVVRNAQGLNPDTLHDTARGADALMAAAQKRVRLIARIFAETGIKDLYLGVHALIRQGGFQASKARLRNGWVEVDPTTWGARSDMTIEVGVGSANKQQEAQAMDSVLALQEKIIGAQGGSDGPMVDQKNVYNALTRYAKVSGIRQPERFFSDPEKAEPKAEGETPPDPAMVEAQAKLAMQQQESQAKAAQQQAEAQASSQLAQQKAQEEAKLARYKADLQRQTDQERMAQDMALKRYQVDEELKLKREQLQAELDLKREQMAIEAQFARTMPNASVDIGRVDVGGDPG